MGFITATYQVLEDTIDLSQLKKLAEKVAIGQTLGTDRPDILSTLSNFVGQVNGLEIISKNIGQFKISYPTPQVINGDLGMLLCTVFGKISMLGNLSLVDLEIDEESSQLFAGPNFGIQGTRNLLDKKEGEAFLMSIFKPCVGLEPKQLAEMMATQHGVDFVMDDELLADQNIDSAKARLEACLNASQKIETDTGHKILYALQLTGPANKILERAQQLKAQGAQAFLFAYWCYGLPLLSALAQEIQLPILGHPAMAGAFYGKISNHLLFGLLPRLAGADLVLSPSPLGNIKLEKAEALKTQKALIQKMGNIKPSLITPSAGVKPEMVNELISIYGKNVVINAGTGVYDDPLGPEIAIKKYHAGFVNQTVGVA